MYVLNAAEKYLVDSGQVHAGPFDCQCFSPLMGQIASRTHPQESHTHTPRQGRQLAKWRSDLRQVLSECYRSLSK